METNSVSIIQIMQDHAQSQRDAGNLEGALESLTTAVAKAEQILGPDQETIDAFTNTLHARATVLIEMGDYDQAIENLKDAIDQLSNCPEQIGQIGNLYATMGSAYDGLENYDKVVQYWSEAVRCFEHSEPPMVLAIATISNNLGYTAKARGDFNTAEDFFLKALNIMISEYGQKHEQTASVLNNLGAFYLAAGFSDQAREMHTIALETRSELFGEAHPDTAQSLNNLALAFLQGGDREGARIHFDKALSAFEALGPDYIEDIISVSENYCDFLREEGEGSLAENIAARTHALMA